MTRSIEPFSFDGTLPDAGKILDAQRAAAGNVAHMASTACHYAMSMNRAWLDLWNNQLTQCMQIPERLTEAQTDFVEQAFDHYRESIHQLSGLAQQAQEQTQGAMRQAQETAQGMMRETQEAGERAAQQFSDETKERAKGARPAKEGRSQSGEYQRGAEPAGAH
jgi:hypothetical protein